MTQRAAPEIKASRPAQVQAYEPSPQMMDKWQSNIQPPMATATMSSASWT